MKETKIIIYIPQLIPIFNFCSPFYLFYLFVCYINISRLSSAKALLWVSNNS